MRNSDVESVKNFVEEIEKFYPQAKEYLANRVGESKRGNRYPTVFYAALKNKKWGVTFPGVFDIKPSAIECPNIVNNELFATALAMKVEYMYKLGNYTYLHWARNYGYLSSHKNDWDTGFEYIRSNKNYEDEDRYLLYITILSSLGTSMMFLYPNFLIIASTISSLYISFSLLTLPVLLS